MNGHFILQTLRNLGTELGLYFSVSLRHNRAEMDDGQSDRRLKLEAEVLFHLWAEGATPLYKLLQVLPAPVREARAAVASLAAKRYIYPLFEPPEDEAGAVYYLTSAAHDRLARLFRGDPRYHLKELWYALKQEETKVRLPQVRLGGA